MAKRSLKLLFIEKNQAISQTISPFLQESGIESYFCADASCLMEICQTKKPQLVVIDWPLPGAFHSIEAIFHEISNIPAVVLAKKTDLDQIEALAKEHFHGLQKPVDTQELCKIIKHFQLTLGSQTNTPVAADPSSQQLLNLARQVAKFSVPVMISGESGVGKELVARYIHDHSDRADKPFIAVNCAAIPATMLESVMFGYEKGAFTGAMKSTPGKFEQAQGGSILLDEISEMPLELQAKLLRVLQEKEVERLGSQKNIPLDVRVIATSNRNLQQEVAEGRFRMDLFYRLNVFPIHWIPMRHRPLDVLPLVEYLLQKHSELMHRSVPTLTEEAKKALLAHDWPGNAREVDNVIQRSLIVQPGNCLDAKDFYFDDFNQWKSPTLFAPLENIEHNAVSLEEQEYELILKTLRKTFGNRTNAAKILKISPRTLRYKIARMRDLGMDVPEAKLEIAEI